MTQKGFSLIELTVVLAIASILLTVATLSYNDWQVKYNVEKETKELVADLNSLRLRAIHSKAVHRAEISQNTLVFKRSNSEEDDFDEDDNQVVERKALRYKLKNEDGSEFTATKNIDFDSRGYTSNFNTLRVESPKANAAYDCVIIAAGRTNMGKIEDGACTPK